MTSEIAPLFSAMSMLERTAARIDEMLMGFQPSSLEELDRIALLNRTDTKFLLAEHELLSVIPSLAEHYRVLDIRRIRRHRYRTIYFDTPNWYLYHQHRIGQTIRHKVRRRSYLDSGWAFLEVKSKDSQGRTVKHRIPTMERLVALTPEGVRFVSAHMSLDATSLRVVLRNEFTRVTLVHKRDAERLTLDFELRFDHEGVGFSLPGVAIAEVKQSGFNPESPFMEAMSAMGEQPSSVSKYCVGIARLHAEIEQEAFAPIVSAIDALTASAG